MNDLEIDRARKQARHWRVLSWTHYVNKLRRNRVKSPGFAAVIREILQERRLRKVFVPGSFPHGLARELRRLKIKVKVREGHFFPERELKTADEVKKISAALMMAEVGLAEGIQALKNSRIGKKGTADVSQRPAQFGKAARDHRHCHHSGWRSGGPHHRCRWETGLRSPRPGAWRSAGART